MVEGFVRSWSDGKSVLSSKDGYNLLLIMDTAQDVYMVKIQLVSPDKAKTILTEAFEKVKNETSGHDLSRLRSLAELRMAMGEQERKMVAEKLTEHTVKLG
jgi:hypothetical protein